MFKKLYIGNLLASNKHAHSTLKTKHRNAQLSPPVQSDSGLKPKSQP